MTLTGLENHLNLGDMVVIGGLLVKVGAEYFRNKEQDKKMEAAQKKLDALHDYVTNGVGTPGGGLAAKFVLRRECQLMAHNNPKGEL